MAYRFKLDESFEEGSKRIAREQIERAQRQLLSQSNQVVAVHETRKVLKRLRALLRLIRPVINEALFRAENMHLREIAQILSNTRDRHVLVETVAKLEETSGLPSKGVGSSLRKVIQAANGGSVPTVEKEAMKQSLARLSEAKKRFAHLKLAGDGFDVIGSGLQTSYRKGRRAFHLAYREPTDEAFHEWRKGVQQHWRHMLLLSQAWPDYFAARVNQARALSQLLGDDHDLAMLIDFVRAEPTEQVDGAHGRTVEKLARQRQQELRSSAHPVGKRLFAEGASSLHRSVALYWNAAVEERQSALVQPEHPTPRSTRRKATRRAAPNRSATPAVRRQHGAART